MHTSPGGFRAYKTSQPCQASPAPLRKLERSVRRDILRCLCNPREALPTFQIASNLLNRSPIYPLQSTSPPSSIKLQKINKVRCQKQEVEAEGILGRVQRSEFKEQSDQGVEVIVQVQVSKFKDQWRIILCHSPEVEGRVEKLGLKGQSSTCLI